MKKINEPRVCLDCSSFTESKNIRRCPVCKDKHNKSKQKEYRATKQYSKTPSYKYKSYKLKASERNYSFDITFEEFMLFWNKPCFYCNTDIQTIGLDRVDNFKGYTIDNIVSCCTDCNTMKMSKNKNEFIQKCITISNLHKSNNSE